jgi:hypothetical protein
MNFFLKRLPRKRTSGVLAIEIAISAFLIIAIAAFGACLTCIIWGMSVNDIACRDAARAAGQQSSGTQAQLAANTQLQSHATDGYWVTQPTLTNFVYCDYGPQTTFGNTPGSPSGTPPSSATIPTPYVVATTQVYVRVPVPANFFGIQFGFQSSAANGGNGMLQFTRSYVYPIIKTQFYG